MQINDNTAHLFMTNIVYFEVEILIDDKWTMEEGEEEEEEEEESEEEDNNVQNSDDQHFEIGVNNDDDIQINLGKEDPTPKITVKVNRVGRYHKMLDCEREFILNYASLPSQYITKGPKSQEEYIKNLIYIVNHFLDYGFNLQGKTRINEEDQ